MKNLMSWSNSLERKKIEKPPKKPLTRILLPNIDFSAMDPYKIIMEGQLVEEE